MLRNPKPSYGSFNSKLKELACGYGTDNEPNICCPLDDSWLRDVGTDDHSSEESDAHDTAGAIGWDEGYTNRKSDQWSRERFKYIPMTASGKDGKRADSTRTPTAGGNRWKQQRPQNGNTIAQFEYQLQLCKVK